MLPVSKAFQEAIRQPYRKTSVRGTFYIRTGDGIEAYDFNDSAIVQKSLVIKDQLTGGKFGYGGANIRNLNIKLDCDKIPNLDPFNINLTGAEILLWFNLTLADGTPEEVFLGSFFINSKDSSRKFNILNLVGEDCLTKLDVASTAMSNVTPYEVYSQACALALLDASGNTQSEVNGFPNGDLSVSFDTSQIQTARDMLMWTAKLTGTIVRAKRQVEPCIEFVQIPTKYTVGGTAGNFNLAMFKEDNGSIIPADLRRSTDYTDTSIRITSLQMDFQGKRILGKARPWTFAPDTLEGTMELEANPLLNGKDESAVENALVELADYTEDLRFCPFKVTFAGNPAIEIGDFVYLEPGGGIDDKKFYHYGIVTYYKWVYDGDCEIRCSSDVAAERPSSGAVSAASITSTFTSREQTSAASVAPKSQLEKKMQGTAKASPATTDRLEATSKWNNQKYIVMMEPGTGGLEFYTIDSSGNKNWRGAIRGCFDDNAMLQIITASKKIVVGGSQLFLVEDSTQNIRITTNGITFGGHEIAIRTDGSWWLDNKKVMFK